MAVMDDDIREENIGKRAATVKIKTREKTIRSASNDKSECAAEENSELINANADNHSRYGVSKRNVFSVEEGANSNADLQIKSSKENFAYEGLSKETGSAGGCNEIIVNIKIEPDLEGFFCDDASEKKIAADENNEKDENVCVQEENYSFEDMSLENKSPVDEKMITVKTEPYEESYSHADKTYEENYSGENSVPVEDSSEMVLDVKVEVDRFTPECLLEESECGNETSHNTSMYLAEATISSCDASENVTISCSPTSLYNNEEVPEVNRFGIGPLGGKTPAKLRWPSDEKRFQCSQCYIAFARKSALIVHERVHTGEKPFECIHCHRFFARRADMKVHTRVHSGEKPFKCNYCDRSFAWNGDLKTHIRMHTGFKPFQCRECGKAFAKSVRLLVHMRSHTRERLFKCERCDRSFSQNEHLKSHLRTHTGDRPFKCVSCDACFAQKSNLKRHITVSHPDPNELLENRPKAPTGEKLFKCLQCDASFTRNNNLTHHVKAIHREYDSLDQLEEKSFKCIQCDAAFARNSNLNRHIKVVHRKTDRKCSQDHLKPEPGEKIFKCLQCDASFARNSNLTRHIKVVHAERDISPSQNDLQLQGHLNPGTEDKPFKCMKCDASFSKSSNLLRHTKMVHK